MDLLCIKTSLNKISWIIDEIQAQSRWNSGVLIQFLWNFTLWPTVQLILPKNFLKNISVFVVHYNTIVPKITRFKKNASVVSMNYSSLDTFFDQISLFFEKWQITEIIPSYFELYTLIYIINYILHYISISLSLELSLFSLSEVIIISSKWSPTTKVPPK